MKIRILSLALALLFIFSLAPRGASTAEQNFSKDELLQIWEWLVPTMLEEGIFPLELTDLGRGDRGDGVSMLQLRLRSLGYYSKALDGSFGAGTQAAWRKFEQEHGLRVDGIASVEEQILLYSKAAIAQEVPIRSSNKTKKPSVSPTPSPKPTRTPRRWVTPTPRRVTASPSPTPSPTPKYHPIHIPTTLSPEDLENLKKDLAVTTPKP